MKGKERHFHGEAKKDSAESEPRHVAVEQTVLSQIGERGEIESTFREIDSEKREQHRDAAQECVNEKRRCSPVPVFSAPDFDEQERWYQAHLIEQKPEHEILRSERAVKRRLHHQHQRAKATSGTLREKRERKDERGQQDEQKTQTIDPDEIFGADRRNPGVAFDNLEAGCAGVEASPQHDGQNCGERVESEGDSAGIVLPGNAHQKSSRDRKQNQRCDHASHA